MHDKADPPDEGRCGSFFAPGGPGKGEGDAGIQPGTKCYNVLQNNRKRCSGAVCLKYSEIDERETFFERPFSRSRARDRTLRAPYRSGARAAAKTTNTLPLSAPAAPFCAWSHFEQKPLAGIVFATFRFEKTDFWLY